MSEGSISKKKNPTPEKGIRKMRKKKKKLYIYFSYSSYFSSSDSAALTVAIICCTTVATLGMLCRDAPVVHGAMTG
jgi:hypothetical protein